LGVILPFDDSHAKGCQWIGKSRTWLKCLADVLLLLREGSLHQCELSWEENVDSTEWLGLLRPFTAVETLHIYKQLDGHVTENVVAEKFAALRSLYFEVEPTGVGL
jgi:hypothetical protein